MSINDKITFFYTLEESIWNNKVDANKYLATLSILFVAVLGGLAGGGSTLESFFNWDTAPLTSGNHSLMCIYLGHKCGRVNNRIYQSACGIAPLIAFAVGDGGCFCGRLCACGSSNYYSMPCGGSASIHRRIKGRFVWWRRFFEQFQQ